MLFPEGFLCYAHMSFLCLEHHIRIRNLGYYGEVEYDGEQKYKASDSQIHPLHVS